MTSPKVNRRKFLSSASISTAGIIMGGSLSGGCSQARETGFAPYDIMKDVAKYRKIDAHAHVMDLKDIDEQLRVADSLFIEKLQISRPVTNFSGKDPEGHDQVIKFNDLVHAAMKLHPDRYIGFFTLNPIYQKESMEEIRRCVDMGMAGFKGYTQVKVSDALYYPVIEKLIELNMTVYLHAECQLGVGGYRMKYDVGKPPNTSTPEDFVAAAKRYPKAIFHFAHIGGGFDWEYQCKMIKDYPNIYVDTGGSNNEENIVDFAIRHLGEDRIFFGTDGCFHHGVGKVLASNATEEQKRKIFFDNYNNVLRKGGHNVA